MKPFFLSIAAVQDERGPRKQKQKNNFEFVSTTSSEKHPSLVPPNSGDFSTIKLHSKTNTDTKKNAHPCSKMRLKDLSLRESMSEEAWKMAHPYFLYKDSNVLTSPPGRRDVMNPHEGTCSHQPLFYPWMMSVVPICPLVR